MILSLKEELTRGSSSQEKLMEDIELLDIAGDDFDLEKSIKWRN